VSVRILDLDGSLLRQPRLLQRFQPAVYDLRWWGPRVRLGCSFRRFRRLERAIATLAGSTEDTRPQVTLLGSGDFHHVSLALLRRLREPFNLLILDNHPDWMRGIPFLHCGTWVKHAAQLPLLRSVYHVGGDVDFDNSFRWLAPWRGLRSGKIRVIAGVRRYTAGGWAGLQCPTLRQDAAQPADRGRIDRLLEPWADDLGRHPLYISVDKDVLTSREAVVNWDSGHLRLQEMLSVLTAFAAAAGGRVAGVDVLGDWSPVRLRGLFRRLLHWTEHPRLKVAPLPAAWRNQDTNLMLLEHLTALVRSHLEESPFPAAA
jgi:hypothetical protein